MCKSLEEVSKMVSASQQRISEIEIGRSAPSLQLIMDLSDALAVEPKYFLDGLEPNHYVRGLKYIDTGFEDAVTGERYENPMQRRDAVGLLRAFYKIPHSQTRKRIYDLILSLSAMASAIAVEEESKYIAYRDSLEK